MEQPISIKRDEIFDKDRRPLVVVSTVLMPNGRYETAVLSRDRRDLKIIISNTEERALRIHGKMVAKYAREKPLAPRYVKLSEDLKKAAQAAREAAEGDDGGTCNFDSLRLSLPRFSERNTLRAIEAAGLHGIKTSEFGRTIYLVSSPVFSQGNARTQQAEKMRDVMKEAGYDAGVWYQID